MRFLIAGLGSIGGRHLRNLIAWEERDVILNRTYTSQRESRIVSKIEFI